jgi:hypothetical protein
LQIAQVERQLGRVTHGLYMIHLDAATVATRHALPVIATAGGLA